MLAQTLMKAKETGVSTGGSVFADMLITVQANTRKAWLSIRLSPVVVISKGGWNVIIHLSKDFMNQELLNIRFSMLCSAFSSHTL